ncbi:MAG TPA: ABC transporter ATP-binding protein [Fibrobacteria bacterium]|nr:ABC transporter ATP-binding protein [Fibrobacteria bacterium]
MSEPVLSARGIRKTFRENGQELSILDGVDLDVAPGEVVAVVGVSGSGKSTMLSILGTLDRPDSGSLVIGGERTDSLGDSALSRLRSRTLGFVFQFHHLLPDLDALENVALPARIAGVSDAESRDRARELLEASGLGGRLHHRPGQLSGGERQRAALARALANRPRLVLADEPTGNLDPANALKLLETLQELSSRFGQAFLIATHDPDLAGSAHRRMRLAQGLLAETP